MQQHPGYEIEQHNIVIDVMGECSTGMRKSIRELVGEKKKADHILNRMQKAILTMSLHILQGVSRFYLSNTFKFQTALTF